MLYAAKCYWPGVTESDLQQVAERAADASLTPTDSTVTCGDHTGYRHSEPTAAEAGRPTWSAREEKGPPEPAQRIPGWRTFL
jgi:hypothetical protein